MFKGKDTRVSRVWKEFSTEDKRAEHGYPEESLYAVQERSWIGTQRCGLPLPSAQRPQGVAPT
jgi:hypothetical protein